MTASEILKKAREQAKMSQTEFAEYFQIPRRTLQDWEYNRRKMPYYLLRLMIYKLEVEKLAYGLSDELEDGESL